MSDVLVDPITIDPPAIDRPIIMRQQWAELAYFHWRYPADLIQSHLPDGLVVDTLDGSAWVGLVPFVMRDIRLGRSPRIPYLGTFVEINLRTYVVDSSGRRAVWFWSLDIPRSVCVGLARVGFSLPYCWSAGARYRRLGSEHRYTMRRSWPRPRAGAPHAELDLRYTVGDRIPEDEATEFEHFVSARWAYATERRGGLRYGPVRHARWDLFRATDVTIDQSLIEAAGLPAPTEAPHALCTATVDSIVGWPEPIARAESA